MAVAGGIAVLVGGFSMRLGALALSVRQPARPFALACALLLVRETLEEGPSRRSRRRFVALYCGLLLSLAAASTPRLVGDGHEYLAVTWNLAQGRPPALTPAEWERFSRLLAADFGGAPPLVGGIPGGDGRVDVLHFWLYPALAVPAQAALRALGPPTLPFFLLNAALLAAAAAILHSRVGAGATLLLLGGPILWWVDKVHPEVFFFSLGAGALALLPGRPAVALLLLALAAAQNPVFGVALAAAAAWIALRGRLGEPFVWPALVAAAGLALANPLYYLARAARPFPLRDTVLPHSPNLAELGAVVWDPNLGLVPGWPNLALTTLLGLAVLLSRRDRRPGAMDVLCLLLAGAALLFLFTQPGNMNHGGTRGMSRYALWLAPLALPCLAALSRGGRVERFLLAGLAAVSLAYGLGDYHPRMAERYLTPTPVAEWIWTHVPGLDRPLPEVFAERAWGFPPLGRVPASTPACEKALLMGDGTPVGRWPLPCAPAEKPLPCRAPGVFCYAHPVPGGYSFARGPAQPTFLDPLSPRWYWSGQPSPELVHQLAGVPWKELSIVAPADEGVFFPRREGAGRIQLRTAPGAYVAWFDSPRRPGAWVSPAVREPSEAVLLDPHRGEGISHIELQPVSERRVELPAGRALLLVVKALDRRP